MNLNSHIALGAGEFIISPADDACVPAADPLQRPRTATPVTYYSECRAHLLYPLGTLKMPEEMISPMSP
jgi:hypothetical protein